MNSLGFKPFAGKTGRLRSLALFAEHYRPPVAVRVYGDRFRRDGGIASLPLYGLERLQIFLNRIDQGINPV